MSRQLRKTKRQLHFEAYYSWRQDAEMTVGIDCKQIEWQTLVFLPVDIEQNNSIGVRYYEQQKKNRPVMYWLKTTRLQRHGMNTIKFIALLTSQLISTTVLGRSMARQTIQYYAGVDVFDIVMVDCPSK